MTAEQEAKENERKALAERETYESKLSFLWSRQEIAEKEKEFNENKTFPLATSASHRNQIMNDAMDNLRTWLVCAVCARFTSPDSSEQVQIEDLDSWKHHLEPLFMQKTQDTGEQLHHDIIKCYDVKFRFPDYKCPSFILETQSPIMLEEKGIRIKSYEGAAETMPESTNTDASTSKYRQCRFLKSNVTSTWNYGFITNVFNAQDQQFQLKGHIHCVNLDVNRIFAELPRTADELPWRFVFCTKFASDSQILRNLSKKIM
eukprot:g42489.t1